MVNLIFEWRVRITEGNFNNHYTTEYLLSKEAWHLPLPFDPGSKFKTRRTERKFYMVLAQNGLLEAAGKF